MLCSDEVLDDVKRLKSLMLLLLLLLLLLLNVRVKES